MIKTTIHLPPSDLLHVAVGVIKNSAGDILISQRPADVHQGGLWEFPGGKVEAGESVIQALRRELQEELGIVVNRSEPLIKIQHHYPDLSVLLDVWLVEEFSGEAHMRENQPIRWVSASELKNYSFPEANLAIIHAAQLPEFYAILNDTDPDSLMADLEKILSQNIRLIQARLKNLSPLAVEEFLQSALPLCHKFNAQLLLNSAAARTNRHFHHLGLHLTSQDLMLFTERPKTEGWLAASCHNLTQLRQAEKIGVDFAVLSPILRTKTHPVALTLGWEIFAELVAEVNIPVYALGGLHREDKGTAKALGAQGLAGIRTFLS